MRFGIIYSAKNIAGKNIVEQLKKISFLPQVPIIEEKRKEIIYLEKPEQKYPRLKNIDFLVIASTHKSEKAKPALCLHAPGNWRGADLGGQEGKVCMTSAFILKYLFQQLNKNAKQANLKDYHVTLEVTHHGPYTSIPCCFIELGSSEKQWQDKQAATVVAKTIARLQNYKKQNWIPAIGLGGPHYAPVFSQIQLNSQYAISHIIPQYTLPLTTSMLKEAESKTLETIKNIIIDWKGCGKSKERAKTLDITKRFGIEIKRTSEVEK
jgi:D-aminoacyl-tRNA deacylase